MAGLDPAIHPLRKNFSGKSMDPRVKPGVTVSDDPKKEKVPPCGGTFLLSLGPRSELAVALALMVRFLALTIGVLLLLSGLLTAALLLTGLLIGVLVLLA